MPVVYPHVPAVPERFNASAPSSGCHPKRAVGPPYCGPVLERIRRGYRL